MLRLALTLVPLLLTSLLTASPAGALGAKNRVKALSDLSALRVEASACVTPRLHLGNRPACTTSAVGYRLASRAAGQATRVGAQAANVAGKASTPLGRAIGSLRAQLGGGQGPWRLSSAHAEGATSASRALRQAGGGTSIEEVYRHASTGEQLIRHYIRTNQGDIIHETFRTFSKFH